MGIGSDNSNIYNKLTIGGGYYSPSSDTPLTTSIRKRTAIRAKRALVLCLLFLSAVVSLYSSQIAWSWKNPGENVGYYRYQLNGENEKRWTVIDGSIENIILPSSGRNILHIQASYDGDVWSESAVTSYTKPLAISLRTSLAPYGYTYYSFYNGHDIPLARDTMDSVYGLTASIEADFTIMGKVRLYPEAGYSLRVKRETIIPGESSVHYIKAGLGIDLTLPVTDYIEIYTGYAAGAVFHINNRKANVTAYAAVRLGFDYIINGHLTLGAFTRVDLAYSYTSHRLTDSISILTEPLSLSLSYMF